MENGNYLPKDNGNYLPKVGKTTSKLGRFMKYRWKYESAVLRAEYAFKGIKTF
jgi:hypothetical protein